MTLLLGNFFFTQRKHYIVTSKVIIYKSCGEVSLFRAIHNWIFVFILFKIFAHKNMKKLVLRVAYFNLNWAVFSTANRQPAQN